MIGVFLAVVVMLLMGAVLHALTVQMLVSVSFLLLGIFAARKFLRGRIRAGMIQGLWILILLRMFFCLIYCFSATGTGPDSSWSMNRAVNAVVSNVTNIKEQDGEAWKDMEVEPTRFDLSMVELPRWFQIIWVLGVVGFCFLFRFFHERFRRRLFDTRVSIEVPDCPYPVYIVPGISSPCAMKIRGRKGIYLTEEVAEDEEKRNYVLVHEICHLTHHDLFWAVIRNFVLACFWFHPLVWVAAILSKRDNEMACDERAIEHLGVYERKRYGEVLIDLVDTTNRKDDIFYLATTMTAGKRELRQRIQSIAGGSHSREISILAVVLISAVLMVISFTSYVRTDNLTADQMIQHFYYYEAKGNIHGMMKLYPDATWLADSYSRYGYRTDREESVVRILSVTDMTGTEDVPYSDITNSFERYKEAKVMCAEVVRKKYREDYEENEDTDPFRYVKAAEYFVAVRDEAGDSWRIVDWTGSEA